MRMREVLPMISDLDVQQLLRDILDTPLMGYQPMEIKWRIAGGDRKMIVPDSVVAKPQEWFFFDGQNNFKFRKSGVPLGVVPPEMKIINIRFEPTYLNPYGHALLAKCYWPVTFKNGGLRFWVNFTEKYGMPLLLGQYSRGATEEESRKLATELANMTEDTVIVAPSDIDIKLHEAARYSSVSLYKELIKYCNAEISKAILSQTLTTELDSGSYAASNVHYKIRRSVVISDMKLVESVINKIIRFIVALNYGQVQSPVFRLNMNDGEDMQKIDRDTKLVSSGALKFSKEYWVHNYGFKENEILI